ncbi:MAG: 30S ribosomal protein S20 [Alphaproteobacteria bacterium]|nr:30S ribosomal protein S20 [Alphaproteobacteria bacterium]
MANHISAKTRIKRNEKAAAFNASYLNSVRTQVKKVEKAVAAGDKACAQAEFKMAESALAKAAGKGVMKSGTASRKTSRLSARIKAMA